MRESWLYENHKRYGSCIYDKRVSSCFAQLKPYVKSAIHLTLDNENDSEIKIGTSKMGGLPDLPRHVAWFRKEMADIPIHSSDKSTSQR